MSKANGKVLKQSIEAGTTVEEKSKVTITVNKIEEIKTGIVKINVQSLLGEKAVIQKDESGNDIPTGKLKTNSVKKIIYNNKLNPGDKFIIYDKNSVINSEPHISDMGNISHVYGSFPKWLKIHVVAIEDSGKINYLDSTLRWYNEYFIA